MSSELSGLSLQLKHAEVSSFIKVREKNLTFNSKTILQLQNTYV